MLTVPANNRTPPKGSSFSRHSIRPGRLAHRIVHDPSSRQDTTHSPYRHPTAEVSTTASSRHHPHTTTHRTTGAMRPSPRRRCRRVHPIAISRLMGVAGHPSPRLLTHPTSRMAKCRMGMFQLTVATIFAFRCSLAVLLHSQRRPVTVLLLLPLEVPIVRANICQSQHLPANICQSQHLPANICQPTSASQHASARSLYPSRL